VEATPPNQLRIAQYSQSGTVYKSPMSPDPPAHDVAVGFLGASAAILQQQLDFGGNREIW
jgi:hypothetical protein